MKLWNKIKIHPLTYILIFSSLITGLFKYFMLISIVVIVHELGHIIFMKIFKRKICEINLLPFGGLVKVDSDISTNIYEDLLISIGGIGAQLILLVVMYFLYQKGLIDLNFYRTITTYNKMIIGFNLIPICPLDGYKIFKLLSEIFIPYKSSFYFSITVSFVIIILFGIFSMSTIRDNIFVFFFLFVSTFKEAETIKYFMLKFYLERMTGRFKFKRTVYVDKKENMYKNRYNYIRGEGEEKYLSSLYCRQRL